MTKELETSTAHILNEIQGDIVGHVSAFEKFDTILKRWEQTVKENNKASEAVKLSCPRKNMPPTFLTFKEFLIFV